MKFYEGSSVDKMGLDEIVRVGLTLEDEEIMLPANLEKLLVKLLETPESDKQASNTLYDKFVSLMTLYSKYFNLQASTTTQHTT